MPSYQLVYEPTTLSFSHFVDHPMSIRRLPKSSKEGNTPWFYMGFDTSRDDRSNNPDLDARCMSDERDCFRFSGNGQVTRLSGMADGKNKRRVLSIQLCVQVPSASTTISSLLYLFLHSNRRSPSWSSYCNVTKRFLLMCMLCGIILHFALSRKQARILSINVSKSYVEAMAQVLSKHLLVFQVPGSFFRLDIRSFYVPNR
jgi:hypothetical protein